MIAKSYLQVFDVDFIEIYALVVKFTSNEIIIIIQAIIELEMHQINVKSNFLNRKLKKDIYVNQT